MAYQSLYLSIFLSFQQLFPSYQLSIYEFFEVALCIKESAIHCLSVPFLSIFLSFQLKLYVLWWLPPGVCELCSLFAILDLVHDVEAMHSLC